MYIVKFRENSIHRLGFQFDLKSDVSLTLKSGQLTSIGNVSCTNLVMAFHFYQMILILFLQLRLNELTSEY